MKKLLLVSAIALAASPAFADTTMSLGGSSNTNYVTVGHGDKEIQGVLYTGVGINLPANHPLEAGDLTTETVSFEGGPIRQTNNLISGANGNDFIDIAGTIISETWKHTIASGVGAGTEIYAYRQVNPPMPDFPHFGGEVIAKVPGLAASNAVYFGEWAPWDGSAGSDLGMDSSLRTVYYVGENPTTSMPTLTNVAYDVVGIQKYNPDTQAGVYTGTLTATFNPSNLPSGNTLTGTLNGVNFSGTSISSDGSFSNGSTISGKFYGNSAEALAGMYDASGVANDMAFGGAQQ